MPRRQKEKRGCEGPFLGALPQEINPQVHPGVVCGGMESRLGLSWPSHLRAARPTGYWQRYRGGAWPSSHCLPTDALGGSC